MSKIRVNTIESIDGSSVIDVNDLAQFLGADYQTTSFDAGGDFPIDTMNVVSVTKIGNTVTLTFQGEPLHSSSSSAISSSGVLPVEYRPASEVRVVLSGTVSVISELMVNSSGNIMIFHYDRDLAPTNKTSPLCQPTISYIVP